MRYVALGDSYTIGTGVPADQSWPSQLAARLPEVELVANLGVNGFSSADLIAFELPDLAALEPEFATLLIGVNDVVRGVPESDYTANLDAIFAGLLSLLTPQRIVAVATPDYTVTPSGGAFGGPRQRAAIQRFNDILSERSAVLGVVFVAEPFAISRAAGADRSMVAGDGLHPSARQYALWVDAIAPVVRSALATAS